MDIANEILDAIEIIVDKKIRENTVQIYPGVCKGVSGNSCVMSINGRDNTVQFYGSTPTVGTIYRVFVPNGNMSMAFIIVTNDDSSSPSVESASIIVTGLSETDSVSASKDVKTVIGKWGQIPNPAIVVPDGYTQLEYIESDGTQCLDTGVALNSTDLTGTIDFQITDTSTDQWISGAIKSDYSTGIEGGIYKSAFYSSLGFSYSQTSSLTARTTASFSVASGKTNGLTILLFGRNVDGTLKPQSSAKLYSAKIYKSSEIIRDFIPAKRNSDSVVGLYDLVNGVFYTNAGTGTFIAGADVPQTVDGFMIKPISDFGTWTVTATDGVQTATQDVLVDSATQYDIELKYKL